MTQLQTKELIDNALEHGHVTLHDYQGTSLPDLVHEKPERDVRLFLREGRTSQLQSNKHHLQTYQSLNERYYTDSNVHFLDGEAIKLLLSTCPKNAPYILIRIGVRISWLIGLPGLILRLKQGELKLKGITKLKSGGKTQRWLVVEYQKLNYSGFSLSASVGVQRFLDYLRQENVKYVISRFSEYLPKLYRDGGDLDMLVSDEDEHKAKGFLRENPGSIHVDCYSFSSRYYPKHLMKQILDNAVDGPAGSLVPAPREAFLSFAYHAIYHKGFDSGIPSQLPQAEVRKAPENDYSGILSSMAKELNIQVNIDMESLDEYLNQQGWRPESRDMSPGNESGWLYRRFFSHRQTYEVGLGVFILKEKAVQQGITDKFIDGISAHGFTVLASKYLNPEEKRLVSVALRGANWTSPRGESLHEYTPAVAVVLLDTRPYSMLHVKRGSGINDVSPLKKKLRLEFGETPGDSMVHSTDNTREAWEYIEVCFPKEVDNIRTATDKHLEALKISNWQRVHYSLKYTFSRLRTSPARRTYRLIRRTIIRLFIK